MKTKNKLLYSFDDHLNERLKDPAFRKVWEESEPEYQETIKKIEKRLAKKSAVIANRTKQST